MRLTLRRQTGQWYAITAMSRSFVAVLCDRSLPQTLQRATYARGRHANALCNLVHGITATAHLGNQSIPLAGPDGVIPSWFLHTVIVAPMHVVASERSRSVAA